MSTTHHRRARSRPSRWWPVLGTSAALLAWSNLVVPTLPSVTAVRAPVSVAATALLLAAARAAGLRAADLGLARGTWRRGARWGGVAFAVVTAGYLVVLTVPAGRAALADPGLAAMSAGELLVRALVVIPLATVLFEELAFRGVLLAVALRHRSARAAVVVTSAVFGLWHVRTALEDGGPAAGPVVVTGLGGVVLAVLRLRSGSLLAPMGLHLGTNGVGLVAAAVA